MNVYQQLIYLYKEMFWYGHPLVNQGAGRIKTDSLNEQRIQLALSRFQQWASERGILKNFKYSVSKQQMQKSRIVFPLAGLAFGLLASYTFVHPNSKYIGKCFTLFTTAVGYYIHLHYVQAYHASRRFGNFHNYPIEIQRMIDNNDSRYAFKWLKDNYLDIAREDTDATFNTAHKEEEE